jgi:Mce-associated membrane protein
VRRLHLLLYVVVLALTCACVYGGFLVRSEHDDRAAADATQERYGAVLRSATDESEALINIDYRDARASIDRVAAGATGAFAKQYDSSTKGVIELLQQYKSVMKGDVIWAGVSSLDPDSASVIVATTGTVANTQSKNQPVARYFRMRLDLVLVDGAWKTKNLEFVD